MVSPSSASTVVLSCRLVVTMSTASPTESFTAEVSCSSSRRMVFNPATWGVTFNVRPTSSRWMVVNGLDTPDPVLDACPVTNGTFSPTIIDASWLSRVRMLGVDSRLVLVVEASACTSAPHSKSPSASVSPKPAAMPSPRVILEGSSVITACNRDCTLMPEPPKLTAPTPFSRSPARYWKPRLLALSPVTSTMAASIRIWARRTSS